MNFIVTRSNKETKKEVLYEFTFLTWFMVRMFELLRIGADFEGSVCEDGENFKMFIQVVEILSVFEFARV